MQVGILGQVAIFDAPALLGILRAAGMETVPEPAQARRMLQYVHQPLPFGPSNAAPLCAWIADADNI